MFWLGFLIGFAISTIIGLCVGERNFTQLVESRIKEGGLVLKILKLEGRRDNCPTCSKRGKMGSGL